MEVVPNNLDDYGFLTIGKESKQRGTLGSRSLDDILHASNELCMRDGDSYDRSSLYTLERVEDDATYACSRNELIERQLQVETSNVDTSGKRKIRVKFAISDEILNKVAEDTAVSPNEVKKINCVERSKEFPIKPRQTKNRTKLQPKSNKVKESHNEIKPQHGHSKTSWWKKIFTRSQKTVNKDEASNNNRNDITSAGCKSPYSQTKKKENRPNLATSTIGTNSETLRLSTKGGSVDCLLEKTDNVFPVRQFQSSPVRRHHSSLSLCKNTLNDNSILSFVRDDKYRHTIHAQKNNHKEMLTESSIRVDKRISKVPQRSRDATLNENAQAKQNSCEVSGKVKAKSKRKRFSFSLGSKAAKEVEFSNTSDYSSYSSLKESITDEAIREEDYNRNIRRKEDNLENRKREETFVKAPFTSEGIVSNLYQKYPANKEVKQRRVLVHIHTKYRKTLFK